MPDQPRVLGMIIAVISAISFVLGATLAYVANGRPDYFPATQTAAGVLVLVALALLGFLLEAVFGRP